MTGWRQEVAQSLETMLARLTWPAERLSLHREAALRSLLATACERSAWHRRRLADLDITTLDESGLADLPVMTKDDLMANFDEIVADPRLTRERIESHLAHLGHGGFLPEEYHAVASTGSSGRRGVFVYGREAWITFFTGSVRFLVRHRQRHPPPTKGPEVIAAVVADSMSHASNALPRTFVGTGLDAHLFYISSPLAEVVEGLNRLRPTVLQGYASALRLLAREALAGRLRIAPRQLMATAEPLLPEARAEMEEAWGALVWNLWGTSEGGPTGCSCGEGEGMHLSDDLLLLEPVDAAGLPVPAGVRSARVYLTNLSNPALPLIRYELTDEVVLLPDAAACPCGSSFRRIADIQGRSDDWFSYPGSVEVHPFVFRGPLGREPGVVEYQVRQTAGGAEIAVVCSGEPDLARIERELCRSLAHLGLPQPEVRVRAAERLERSGGKLRRFLPLRPPA